MKNIIIGIMVINLFVSCISESKEVLTNEVLTNLDEPIEDAYKKFIQTNKIKEKNALAYEYKFGEPVEIGLFVYKTIYDKNGNLLDSIVYNSNTIAFHEKYVYNNKNELITRVLIDSLANEVQRSERSFDDNGNEDGFIIYSNDSLYYKQQRDYNDKKELIQLKEFDANDNVKIITKYTYNDKSDLISKTELNKEGSILSKMSYNYDVEGNKTSISNYNSNGDIAGKTILKNYENSNATLIEKYDAFDSLYASYQYEYNERGDEIKSIIYNGIGQVIRQVNTTFDVNGNKTLFEIYEGEVGLLGRDVLKYNSKGQEIELIVFDGNNQKVKRKITTYNDRGLIVKEESYNKIEEPIFQFKYDYSYFE